MSETKELTPQQVFDQLKEKKGQSSYESLQAIYDAALEMGAKYKRTGQVNALKKVLYVMKTIEKEKQLVDLGINRFIYRDDIDFFIDHWNKTTNPIKILELSRYPREIPDEIVDTIEKVRGIFDEFYVLYTDYTGKEEKRIAAEKRSTDPILFGVFIEQDERLCCDRFYYLGDWEDEFCNLTLDRMLSDPTFAKRKPLKYSVTPTTKEELEAYFTAHKEKDFDDNVAFSSMQTIPYISVSPKQGWIGKVKTALKKVFS